MKIHNIKIKAIAALENKGLKWSWKLRTNTYQKFDNEIENIDADFDLIAHNLCELPAIGLVGSSRPNLVEKE